MIKEKGRFASGFLKRVYNKGMKIGLDFDGVIAKTPLLKSIWAKNLFGISIDPYFFGSPYVFENDLISKQEYQRLKHFIYTHARVGRSLEEVEGAREYILRLLKKGHYVSVITSRDGKAAMIAKTWLLRHGLDIPLVSVGVGVSKKQAASGCDIFIDDSLFKIYQLEGAVPHKFLFSWGYNQDLQERGIAGRVNSWHEFYQIISSLS